MDIRRSVFSGPVPPRLLPSHPPHHYHTLTSSNPLPLTSVFSPPHSPSRIRASHSTFLHLLHLPFPLSPPFKVSFYVTLLFFLLSIHFPSSCNSSLYHLSFPTISSSLPHTLSSLLPLLPLGSSPSCLPSPYFPVYLAPTSSLRLFSPISLSHVLISYLILPSFSPPRHIALPSPHHLSSLPLLWLTCIPSFPYLTISLTSVHFVIP